MESQRVKRRARLIPPQGGFTNHIPATIVKGDTRTDEERARARAAYDHWLQDLQHIRRTKPLLDGTHVTEITLADTTSTQSTIGRDTNVVDLTDLSDDDDDNNDTGPADRPLPRPVNGIEANAFYRGTNGEAISGKLLTYQQRRIHINQYPSPGALRFDMVRLRRKVGTRQKTDEQVTEIMKSQLWGVAASVPRTFEDALQQNWLKDAAVGAGARLIRGLPLMEDVVFLRAGNYTGTRSNCFWKAVAYQVYGDHSFDARVKAEHLEYFSEILRWPQHPKRKWGCGLPLFARSIISVANSCRDFTDALYTEMNKTFYSVRVVDSNGVAEDIAANIYQLMTIPCCYTPSIIFEITADLYNLFITVYDIQDVRNGQQSTAHVRNVTMSTYHA